MIFGMAAYTYKLNASDRIKEKNIVVIIPSYNNAKWYKKNLDSVFSQKYENLCIIYVDDNSPDGTGGLVQQHILEKNQSYKVTLIRNERHQGALANLYYAIHSCNDHDIIVLLDGDDWFAHDNVLATINNVYADPNIWLTYGQFKMHPNGKLGFCAPLSKKIVEQKEFRKIKWCVSHLRTFYAGLFKKIKIEDLLYEGEFFSVSWDRAIMYPMIEMSGAHFKFIPDILYIYNIANPINDHKVSRKFQLQLVQYIQNMSPYKEINSLF